MCYGWSDTLVVRLIALNKRHKIIKRIKPIQYQGIFFDSKPHYMKFPKFGQRVVLIATFKKGI